MTPVQFCYYLQGLFELNDITKLNKEQVKIIKKYLNSIKINQEDNAIDFGSPSEDWEHVVIDELSGRRDKLIRC